MNLNPFKGLSKNQQIAAGIGSAIVAGYVLYRHFHPAPSTSSTPVTAADAAGDSTLGYTSTGNASGYGYSTPITSGGGTASTPAGQTPEDWIQAAETGLVNDLGYDPGAVQAAFATWVSGGYLTTAQAAIIHAAVTEFPGGPGYPIKLAPSGGGTGTGSGGGSTAKAPASAPTLSATPHKGYADFGWSEVTGATHYELVVAGAGGRGTGTSSIEQQVSGNHATKVALAPGAYVAKVRANNPGGSGPWSADRRLTVTK